MDELLPSDGLSAREGPDLEMSLDERRSGHTAEGELPAESVSPFQQFELSAPGTSLDQPLLGRLEKEANSFQVNPVECPRGEDQEETDCFQAVGLSEHNEAKSARLSSAAFLKEELEVPSRDDLASSRQNENALSVLSQHDNTVIKVVYQVAGGPQAGGQLFTLKVMKEVFLQDAADGHGSRAKSYLAALLQRDLYGQRKSWNSVVGSLKVKLKEEDLFEEVDEAMQATAFLERYAAKSDQAAGTFVVHLAATFSQTEQPPGDSSMASRLKGVEHQLKFLNQNFSLEQVITKQSSRMVENLNAEMKALKKKNEELNQAVMELRRDSNLKISSQQQQIEQLTVKVQSLQ